MARSLRKMYAYIYVFFMLFGPKIGTYIDTSIIASIITILIYAIKNDFKIPYGGIQKKMLTGLGVIILYSMIVSLINVNLDVVFYGRLLRTIFSILGLYVFCTFSDFEIDEFQNIMTNVILIHAVVVILSATVFVDWQTMLKSFTAYNKHVRQYRSTGLMAGFDMAGLLCNLGIVLTLTSKRFNVLKYIVFIVAIVFTSRFSLMALVITLALFVLMTKGGLKGSLVKTVVLITLGFVGVFGLMLIVFTTTNVISVDLRLNIVFNKIYDLVLTVNEAYARTDAVQTFGEQYTLPNDIFGLLFGVGTYGGGDPGYIRFLNCIGILGLSMVVLWHMKYLLQIIKQPLEKYENRISRNYIIFVFFLLLLLLNFKNSYFYTGTFFEIMIFELFIWNREYEFGK